MVVWRTDTELPVPYSVRFSYRMAGVRSISSIHNNAKGKQQEMLPFKPSLQPVESGEPF